MKTKQMKKPISLNKKKVHYYPIVENHDFFINKSSKQIFELIFNNKTQPKQRQKITS